MPKTSLAAALLLGLGTLALAGCSDKKERDKSSTKDRSEDDDDSEKKKPKRAVDAFKRRTVITEAKNSVGAISRAVLFAFERESIVEGAPDNPVGHVLCKSATPIPAKVPVGGESYRRKDDSGVDFQSGDASTGWTCLRFTYGSPIYFQYSYSIGGTPKLAARGNDVGKGDPNFFEVCAEADLEPGGKTTLICNVGNVQTETNTLRLGTELVELDEED